MKHEITNRNTKNMLAASLKKLVARKPLSKITVSEIVADCGVNRKTFYYHFEDVYALLKWMLEQEAILIVAQFDLLAEYEEAVCFVMDYIEQNSAFLRNICDSLGRDELKRFFYQDFIGIVRTAVESGQKKEGLRVSAEFADFLCRFYTGALADILLEWITVHEKKDRQQTILYLSTILHTALPGALRAAAEAGE